MKPIFSPLRFWTTSDQNSSFHGNIKLSLNFKKHCEHSSSSIFDWISFLQSGNECNHKISHGIEIQQLKTARLAVLEPLDKSP